MIVVADTGPLNYLILLGQIELLPTRFGRVILPQAVALEMAASDAPPSVRLWIANPPSWVDLRSPTQTLAELGALGAGEREAIELAVELNIPSILMDEARGRRAAKGFHLEVTGTLGILLSAAQQGKVDLPLELDKLSRTNFRVSPQLTQDVLAMLAKSLSKPD